MDIGERIKPILKENGMTQRDLAMAVGVTDVSMSRYLSGARMPRADIFALIADALNTTTDYLLGRTAE